MTSNKTFHRLLSMLLLICMLTSLTPAAAFAEESAETEEAVLAEAVEITAEEDAAAEEAPDEPEVLPAEEAAAADEPAEEPAALPVEEAAAAEEAADEPAALPAEEAAEETAEESGAAAEAEPADEALDEPEDPQEPEQPEEPADTAWTMALPFTPGTLTGSGASFSNLTLDFSPADPSIGRTIDAWWIGVEFIAPAAVTAENVGQTTFSMDGGSSWQSFDAAKDGQNADGRYFLYAWVPLTVESVKTLVAAQQSRSWTFAFAWDGNAENAQILVITASPENITLVKDGKNEIKVVAWEITELNESYTVTFDAAGGSAVEAQTVAFGGTATKPEDPQREHYSFLGWFTEDGEPYDFTAPVKAGLTLTARWEGEELRVVYSDGLGHVLKSYPVNYGDPTPVFDGEGPAREGYRFDKWDPELEETVTRNTVYTAQWVKTYTLHFEGYEAYDITVDAGETASFAFVTGGLTQKYSLKDTADEQFLGWDTDADVAHDKVSCAKYTNGQKDTNKGPFSFEMKEDITLYPIFGAMYKLTAMHNDGTENSLNTNDAKPGTYARLMIGTRPTRSGYTLLGYSRSKDAAEPDADLAKTGSTTSYVYIYLEGDTTIWAVWEAKEYVISYDLNGGEGTLPEDYVFTLDNRKDIVLPAAEGYSKEGREFLGWSFGTKISDLAWNKELTASNLKTFYEPGATIPADVLTAANKTIYAVWKYTGVTQSVDLNGGTKGPSGYPKTVNYGTSWSLPLMTTSYYKDVVLPDGTAAKNYIRGWYVVNDGTVHPHGNTAAGANGKITMTEDTTIMALYEYTLITYVDGEEQIGQNFSQAVYSTPVYTFPDGEAVTPAAAIDGPAKLHFAFKGWALEEGGEVKYRSGDPVAFLSDTTLYAVYEDAPYTLSFDANGGEGDVPAEEHYNAGDEVEIPETELVREHYSFIGWADAEGNVYQAGDSVTIPESNVVLTAQWEGEACTVMYTDGEGTLLAALSAEYGSETPTIENPTREGYRFDKWEPELAETVTGDVIYTAQWVKTYTLHFEGYEAYDITVDAGETASFAFVTGGLTQKYSLKDTADEQFLGWDTDADVAHDKVSCAKYTNGQKDTNKGPFSFEMKEDITLYPIFGAMYKLTAMHNDGTENSLNTNDAKPGTYARLMIGTRPTRSGYTLLGYSRSKDAAEPDADLAKTGSTTSYVYIYLEGDTTIWAVWEAKEYVISYDLNGGEGTLPEDYVFTLDNRKDIVLPAAEGYSKEGREFLGWSFGTKISDLAWNKELTASNLKTFYEPGATIPADVLTAANKTIYAVWKYTGVTQSVDLNGGTKGPSGYPKTVNYGTSWSLPLMTTSYYKDVVLPDGTAAKNYIRGWYVVNDGTVHPHGNTAAGANGKITMTEDTTIMALYEYTCITFLDGEEAVGSAFSHAEYSIPVYSFPNSDAITPAVVIAGPEKTGYVFRGWAEDPSGEPVYQAGDELTPLSDMALYAVYEALPCTLSFDANGGENTPESVTADFDSTITLSEAEPVRAGHSFLGWASAADAEAAEYAAGAEYTMRGDAVLYAVWKINQYTLSFDANGGDGAPEAVTVDYGTAVTLESIERANFIFKGWAETADAAAAAYAAGDEFTVEADATLYAVWQHAAGWVKNDEGKWNYYDENGEMVTGWLETDEASYYLDENGDLATGWQEIDGETYWFFPGGSMKTGWKEIDGSWYYFGEDGKMQTGWVESNGRKYFLGEDGRMLTGWQKLEGSWYYFNLDSGSMSTRWKQIDGKWYYLGEDGKMVTGWKQLSGKWYYLQSGGAMKTGWLKLDGYWYWFDDNGVMAANTTLTIDGKQYSFDAKGHML